MIDEDSLYDILTDQFKSFEEKARSKILFIVEVGSRAYSIPSPGSDYDIKFVYARSLDQYLDLKRKHDCCRLNIGKIELDLTDDNVDEENVTESDVEGWDITKFLGLMKKSNVSVFEWLNSPIVYKEHGLFESIRDISQSYWSPRESSFHYTGIARGELEQIGVTHQASVKSYLYIIRSILNSRWILDKLSFPPMSLHEVIDAELEDGIIKEKVDALVEVKMKEGNRLTRGHDFTLEQWMYKEVEELTAETRKLDRSLNNDVETLNNTFKSIIKNLDLAYFNSYDRL